ncbi:MAG: carboxylating nicotinate-nucleotide diphosphorylase [Rubrobacteraceae bacterium]|nr:carboxylating nicotinate-nucleotide diphosphorylase [Rubrobacteraceae bacterium]
MMEETARRVRPPAPLRELARRALEEDAGRGDVTSELTVDEGARAAGRFVAREKLVVFGLEAARAVFHEADPEVRFSALVSEGEEVVAGTGLAVVEGSARSILAAERVALNLLMRLSGVATTTRRYVREVVGTGASVVDTRKTTPGMRRLEKAAVRAGGGVNHRFGLDDGILIKDNHVALAGGVGEAVRRARAGAPHLLKVEAEVENLSMLEEALDAGADAVLLDNMSPEEVAEAVALARRRRPEVVVEVSGGVDLGSVRAYAEAGPDLISVGALTHSAPAADVSLEVVPC